MSRFASSQSRLRLPARIRVRASSEAAIDVRLALADRLASLPGLCALTAVDDSPDGGLGLCLGGNAAAGAEPPLLCRITRDGIAVFGLSDRDRHQVLLGRWGRLERDHVLLHLPRDEQELDVCWRIIEHAYSSSAMNAGETPRLRAASPWDLPRFSRTSLQ